MSSMYNPISILNMQHGINLNGSSTEDSLQLNQFGLTPPRPFHETVTRPHRNATPKTLPSSKMLFRDNIPTDARSNYSSGDTRSSWHCTGCEALERRLSFVEEELRINARRFDEFQQDIFVHLNRLTKEFQSLGSGLRAQVSSRYSDTVSMESGRQPLATPSVRRNDVGTRHFTYDKHSNNPDETQQVIADACVQLESLIADAKSRLNP